MEAQGKEGKAPVGEAAAASAIVDLTGAEEPARCSNLDAYVANYEKEVAKVFSSSRKRQKKRHGRSPQKRESRPKDVDAVDVDELDQKPAAKGKATGDETNAASSEYRQVLGPLRMSFLDSFVTEHNTKRYPSNLHQVVAGSSMHGSRSKKAKPQSATSAARNLQRLYKELMEFQINLPVEKHAAIYCRALESDLTKLRALITGPLDSPYSTGCFLFDIELHDYPNKPPSVRFLTTGGGKVRFNPNLYNDGKVCLSLLGTWSGPGWTKKSTLLQVLVSIQGFILTDDPYFNEPGYERDRGTTRGKQMSDAYNCRLHAHTLKWSILDMLENGIKTYPEFSTVIQRHFAYHQESVRQRMKEWQKSPGVVALVPQVEAALAALPPFQRRRAKHPPREVEVIDVDDDEEEEEDAKPSASNHKSMSEPIEILE